MRVPLGWIRLPLLPLFVAGCASEGWSEPVETHGSMREVMREGRTEGRVALEDAVGRHRYGLGALAGLRGELAVLDGALWVGRPAEQGVTSARETPGEEQATLLALTEVREWHEFVLERDLRAPELEARILELGASLGLSIAQPWPFVLEGDFLALETHVLNGACPYAGTPAPGQEPRRNSFAKASGRAVGFQAVRAAGQLVHHGESLHLHVVLEQPMPLVAHVDATGLAAGGRLRLPVR
jgi:alpha-acetolactate decarboxylase